MKKNPDVSYKELISKIAEKYKGLPDKERQYYDGEYQKKKDQFDVEIAQYEAKYGKVERQNKKEGNHGMGKLSRSQKEEINKLKDQIQELDLPDKPKKPMSAFFLYKQKVND